MYFLSKGFMFIAPAPLFFWRYLLYCRPLKRWNCSWTFQHSYNLRYTLFHTSIRFFISKAEYGYQSTETGSSSILFYIFVKVPGADGRNMSRFIFMFPCFERNRKIPIQILIFSLFITYNAFFEERVEVSTVMLKFISNSIWLLQGLSYL